jgi:DNA-binding transcriptional LysR family regulator
MELSQVRYFTTVCRTLNFTRAAEQCNVSQPALTRAIQRLEDEFGGRLFFRERSLTQLTELGRAMRPHLEAILIAAEAASAISHAKLARSNRSLKIGLGPGIGAADVAGAVREATKMVPDVAIHFDESGPAALIEAMLADKLDCALLPDHCDIPERLHRWPLYNDRAVVVLPVNHKLMTKNAINARDIVDETILVGERYGDFAARVSEVTSYSLRFKHCDGSTSQIMDLICAGLGIALVSNRLPLSPHLGTRPFHEPEITRQILLTVVAGRPLNPTAASFVERCRTQTFS